MNHHRISRILFAAFWLAASHAAPQAAAEQATIAVAANFSLPAAELAAGFARHSGHEVVIASGATGQFYAQILNGAPYDLFLAADQHRPMLLEQAGIAVAGTRFTYATGTLVLWSSSPDLLEDASLEILDSAHVRHIAIANPALAPYGAAARALLENSGQWLRLRPKLAIAQSVGQAYAMAATASAEAGFVAYSQVIAGRAGGSVLALDATGYPPIRQDAVLLAHGAKNEAAIAFADFLRSADALPILERFGYSPP